MVTSFHLHMEANCAASIVSGPTPSTMHPLATSLPPRSFLATVNATRRVWWSNPQLNSGLSFQTLSYLPLTYIELPTQDLSLRHWIEGGACNIGYQYTPQELDPFQNLSATFNIHKKDSYIQFFRHALVSIEWSPSS